VGASHPVVNSLTYKFYTKGWQGITIEPNEAFNTLYKFIRPRDEHINCGIGTENGKADYYVFKKDPLNTFDWEVARGVAERHNVKIKKVKKQIYTLSHILETRNVEKVDYLNVDTEGYDLKVLQSNNWEKWKPKLITIEDNQFTFETLDENEIINYLRRLQYKFFGIIRKNLFFKLNNKRRM